MDIQAACYPLCLHEDIGVYESIWRHYPQGCKIDAQKRGYLFVHPIPNVDAIPLLNTVYEPSDTHTHILCVRDIAVHPIHRGVGVARDLLRMIDFSNAEAVVAVAIDQDAIDFWKHQGFEEHPSKHVAYGKVLVKRQKI